MEKQGQWLLCPHCHGKNRVWLREDTILRNYLLFCPKCKQEMLIDLQQFHIILLKQSDAKTQVFAVLLIVPIVLTIALPSIFVFVISFAPDAASDFQKLLDMLPAPNGEYSQQQQIFSLILNQIMPSFFLIIPIMASSVMAASSFVGEKEKHTLETLLYSPLSLGQLFQSKILAGFSVGMMISYSSFAAMLLVMELEAFFLTGNLLQIGRAHV